MTKKEAETAFREAFPKLPADKPARRQAWNDYIDGLQKDGQITRRQSETWTQPAFINK